MIASDQIQRMSRLKPRGWWCMFGPEEKEADRRDGTVHLWTPQVWKKRKAGDWLYFFNHDREESHADTLQKKRRFTSLWCAWARMRKCGVLLKREKSPLKTRFRNWLPQEGIEKKGRKEGKKKGFRTAMENLLKMDVITPNQIADVTGLTENEVLEIQRRSQSGNGKNLWTVVMWEGLMEIKISYH